MRQVPHFLIIGDGAVAKHFYHYFNLLKLDCMIWSRSQANAIDLNVKLNKVTHVLILISDPAIVPFIEAHILTQNNGVICVHFSGSLSTPLALAAHPLQSFTKDTKYTLAQYQKIPFALEKEGSSLEEVLPGLPNPHFHIPVEKKYYYHALCVLANNITSLFWNKFFREMAETFQVNEVLLKPFLEQTFKNIENNPYDTVSGPFVRKDLITLNKDLKGLEGDNYYEVFKSMIQMFITEVPFHDNS